MKYINESCWLCLDLHFYFKYFTSVIFPARFHQSHPTAFPYVSIEWNKEQGLNA